MKTKKRENFPDDYIGEIVASFKFKKSELLIAQQKAETWMRKKFRGSATEILRREYVGSYWHFTIEVSHP